MQAPALIATQFAPQIARAVTLRSVFDKWKTMGERPQDSILACERALKLFEKDDAHLPVHQIGYEHGAAFKEKVQQSSLAPKTARDYFIWVQCLLNFAHTNLGLIPRNPWRRISIEKPKTTPRRPWTHEELDTLFAHPIFTSYKLPSDNKAGRDAAYWIPIIGLYTGARISEIAQLRVHDITTLGQEALLHITDEDPSQQLKTASSRRSLPVHSELVRLGFLEYVSAIEKSGATSLWPHLPLRKSKPGGYFSQWFGELRKAVGLGQYPDFHCFRHSVRTLMAEACIPESVKDRITGHSIKGSVGTQTYEHVTHLLKHAVETVHYPDLVLPRVY